MGDTCSWLCGHGVWHRHSWLLRTNCSLSSAPSAFSNLGLVMQGLSTVMAVRMVLNGYHSTPVFRYLPQRYYHATNRVSPPLTGVSTTLGSRTVASQSAAPRPCG